VTWTSAKNALRSLTSRILWQTTHRTRHPTIAAYRRDEFLEWLNFIVPGMLGPGNLDLLNHAVLGMPAKGAVVEIGSFAGLSINHVIHMMRQAGRSNSVFSVDEWRFEGWQDCIIQDSSVQFADYREHVIDTFRRCLMLFHADSLPYHVVVSSDEFFRLWAENETVVDFFGRSKTLGGPISFAYIDGDHTYEQSMRDFENVDRFLLPGGFIVLDDSADGSEWGSNRTAREARLHGRNTNLLPRRPIIASPNGIRLNCSRSPHRNERPLKIFADIKSEKRLICRACDADSVASTPLPSIDSYYAASLRL
jgi:hypothetical protein